MNLPLPKFLLPVILSLTTLFFTTAVRAQVRIYVDSASTTGTNNGTSWANAYRNFATAVTNAVAGDTIWVAKGTYQPASTLSFTMANSVAIYGGFAGTETTLAARNWTTNATILKGNGASVINNNSITATAVLDGFTITGGNTTANGNGGGMNNSNSSPTVNNVTFSNNTATGSGFGGGMFNDNTSSPLVTNAIFSNNTASNGGGMLNYYGSPTLINAVFSNNAAPGGNGGGVYNLTCNATFTNVTFSNNTNAVGGGMFNNLSASVTVTNCIFWGNINTSAAPFPDIYNNGGSIANVTYSFTQTATTGIGNITGISDPFANDANPSGADGTLGTADDGLELVGTSTAINAGSNAAIPVGITTDITGANRITGSTVDMGAYEYLNRLYVDSASTGGLNNGSSWANAYRNFATAVTNAVAGDTIWVAKGTYQPALNASFTMKTGVAIYGGFAGTETTLAARNWVTNNTKLKGNGRAVILNSTVTSSAILDGFTVTGGSGGTGGGMGNTSSSPTITNTTFSGNTAANGGGMGNTSSSPTITNTTFSGNTASGSGGGMYNITTSSPTITNVTFSGNTASAIGGGMYNITSSPTITNATFSGNTANIGGGMVNSNSSPTITNITFSGNQTSGSGGGIYNTATSSPTITNVTFSGNKASVNGGGMYNNISSPKIINVTFSKDTASNGGGIYNTGATTLPTITNCVFWGNIATTAGNDILNAVSAVPVVTYCYTQTATTGTGNITGTTDPFVNDASPAGADGIFMTADDGLELVGTSAAFNTGSNAAIPVGITTDITGANRIIGGTVDMGAYERSNRIYVDSASTSGENNGTNWANAYRNFATAVTNAVAGDTIWVAKGTYQPALNTSFTLETGVVIYGGFAGTENTLAARNWTTNVTKLKGNGASVINNSSITATAVLDGFTITGGNTAGNGGGMNNSNSSPTLNNVTFFNNNASTFGGGMFNDNTSSPLLTNAIFSNNTASNGGGMLNYNGGSPTLINAVFSNNAAPGGNGGGVYNLTCNATFTNVTFSNNTNATGGGMFNNLSAVVTVTNCIFWGNINTSAAPFPDIYNNGGSSANVTYSFTQTATAGTGNITGTTDPFINDANPTGPDGIFGTTDDGLQLLGCSNAVNTGINTANATTTDIAKQPRVFNTTIDMGAYEYQAIGDGTSLALNSDVTSQPIYPGTEALITTGSCRIIAKILPGGASPEAGITTAKVYIDPTIQSYLGQPYIKRHYDITPATGAATATATITLYATQAEFDSLNLHSSVKLPTGPADNAGIANLNVIQFHGTSATGTPGTYSGSTVIIDPNNANIIWNSTLSRWEITFNVTGFSGFIITPVGGTVLSLNLLSFTGQLVNSKSQLQWQTANEVNTGYFEVDKSLDGTHFDSLTTVKADGSGNNSYTTVDEYTQIGDNYYRLKSIDKDGSYTYSDIIVVKVGSNGNIPFVVSPNPASQQLVVRYDAANNSIISIYTLTGQKVLSVPTNGQSKTTIDVSHLSNGTYIIQYKSDTENLINKFIKVD